MNAKIKKWALRRKPIGRTPSSENGLSYEITSPASVAEKSTPKTRKAYIAHISKAGKKKPRGSSLSTAIVYATDVTPISTKTPKNIGRGKSKKRVQAQSTGLMPSVLPTTRKTERPKPSTGRMNWLNTPHFSIKDVIIAVLLTLVIRLLIN